MAGNGQLCQPTLVRFDRYFQEFPYTSSIIEAAILKFVELEKGGKENHSPQLMQSRAFLGQLISR
jgi:hypothetical protein